MANKKISELPSGSITSASIFPFVEGGITSRGTFSNVVTALEPYFSPAGFIPVTKTELDALITGSTLEVGATYQISGVHPTLYNDGSGSGTTIYLKAMSSNTLSSEGYGEFWNPNYNQSIEEYGIWSNRSFFTATLVSGRFISDENLTANNGATAKLFNTFDSGTFLNLTGDWTTATGFTGQSSSAVATVSSVTIRSYAIGAKAIWGGYSWTNLDGTIGSKTSEYALNASWSKDLYTTADYSKVYDIISYDYTHDWINRRYDIRGNNDVKMSFSANDDYSDMIISSFQFGNPYNDTFSKGVGDNRVDNAVFQCINFGGAFMADNVIEQKAYIVDNVWARGVEFSKNIFQNESWMYSNQMTKGNSNTRISRNFINNSGIEGNRLTNTRMEYNVMYSSTIEFNKGSINASIGDNFLKNSSISSNIAQTSQINQNLMTDFSSISSNNMVSSYIINNTLDIRGSIDLNIMTTGTTQIYYNDLRQTSSIKSNTFATTTNILNNKLHQLSIIQNNTFTSVNFEVNSLTNGTISGITLSSKTIKYLWMEAISIDVNISGATVIYALHPKTAYKRPDGAIRLRYYDNADTLVITGITA